MLAIELDPGYEPVLVLKAEVVESRDDREPARKLRTGASHPQASRDLWQREGEADSDLDPIYVRMLRAE